MQDGFMAETAETRMAMNYLNLLANDNVSKYGEEREDCWEGCFSVDDQERNVVDFEAVCEIPNSSSSFICVSDDNNFVSAINELAGELVDVAFDSSWLGEEVVAHHGNIVAWASSQV